LMRVIFPNLFSAGIGAGAGGSGECLDTIIGETDAEQPILEGDDDDINDNVN
jgi:hypothetical protein